MRLQVKKLTLGMKRSGGRNCQGRITVHHRGGGLKRRYKMLDYVRVFKNIPAVVRRLEIDATRKGYVMLISYSNGYLSYVIAFERMLEGGVIMKSKLLDSVPGNTMMMKYIPVGMLVHNVELYPGRGGQLIRAGGSSCMLVKQEKKYSVLKLPSGEFRRVSNKGYGTIGVIKVFKSKVKRRAGMNRLRGRRPVVRGVAMNPVDHPHGGGEGKTSGGRPSVSPWSVLTKGFKTRRKRKHRWFFLNKETKL